MELNEFIKNVTDDLYKELQKSTEKLLIQDIIMIYNGYYCNYEYYTDSIIKNNNRIDEIKSIGFSYTIHPKHIILDKEIYNFIESVAKCYKYKGD